MLIEHDLLQASYPISRGSGMLLISLTRDSSRLEHNIQQGDQKFSEVRG